MTDRERFLRLMNYEPVDRHPIHLVEPWCDTLLRWRNEGLPAGITDVHDYLGVPRLHAINIVGEFPYYPKFETRILERDENFEISIDSDGRTVRAFKDHTSMPERIDFPVKDGEDLRRVMDEHLDITDLDARFGAGFEESVKRKTVDNPNALVITNGGGYYWQLRSMAGVEVASYLLHDEPALVEELFERIFVLVMEGLRRVTARVQVDVIGYGEDLACKTGPLLAPSMVRELILPRYRAALDVAHEKNINLTWYDSDGDFRMLIPDFLSIGINGFAPCEVAAGMDPVELRKTFGKELRMLGGFDKRIVAAGKEAIDAEFERLRPVIEEGGYLPAIDHSVSSDISWDNYRHFLDAVQKHSGH
ncbi:MAG: uroporphyrinogen decarboxylase family protein [Verrucomicrobiota bacterium]